MEQLYERKVSARSEVDERIFLKPLLTFGDIIFSDKFEGFLRIITFHSPLPLDFLREFHLYHLFRVYLEFKKYLKISLKIFIV